MKSDSKSFQYLPILRDIPGQLHTVYCTYMVWLGLSVLSTYVVSHFVITFDKYYRFSVSNFLYLWNEISLKSNSDFHLGYYLTCKCVLFVTEIMMNMGYSRKEIEDSLSQNKYDEITATYLLLGRRTMEVSKSPFSAKTKLLISAEKRITVMLEENVIFDVDFSFC